MFDIIMGNEESHQRKVDLDNDAVEVTDNWTLYYARNFNGCPKTRSAFISGRQGESELLSDSLKRLAKNLMIHRHPCIVQFVSSWGKSDSFYLITEEVRPLSHVLGNQSALQICIGLHNIVKALTFLHEKAQSSHNNLCCASVYVTPEGVWKLGGLDYLMKFSDVTGSYLQQSRAHRYEKAVPPEEDSLNSSKVDPEAIDAYAFGVLVDEVLKKKTSDEVPHLTEFKTFCKKRLNSPDPLQRSKLSEVALHPFFNHEFIRIHKFLSELPLKVSQEKEDFFRDLTVQLSVLPEEIVASQLASLLLSRMVILDETAQQHLLPIIMQPRTGDGRDRSSLFSVDVFRRHVVPKLLHMFCVRDAQVRLILLNHFPLFCDAFTLDELKHQVLPELLIGIKDVNDQLVSATLRALADLVLVLGASTVIGGKRGKLFTDGRPKAHGPSNAGGAANKVKERDKESPAKGNRTMYGELPERLSPDGGEDGTSTTTVGEGDGVDGENWSDWESPGEKEVREEEPEVVLEEDVVAPAATASVSHNHHHQPTTLPDISALDIKCNVTKSRSEAGAAGSGHAEFDFFHDMEPVISKTQSLEVVRVTQKNKFDISVDSADVGGEWDDGWALEDDESGIAAES